MFHSCSIIKKNFGNCNIILCFGVENLHKKLDEGIYMLDALTAAPMFLGKILVRRLPGGEELRLRITETEAYCGEEDTACHAKVGRTKRTQTLYEKGGTAYVYLCYGIHSLFNIVTGEIDAPQAVLVRGVEGAPGPGRATKALSVSCALNGIDLANSDELWLEDDGLIAEYVTAPRVGIDYAAEPYKSAPWRFILTNIKG